MNEKPRRKPGSEQSIRYIGARTASQNLAAGQSPILFKDTTFSSPQDLTHDFDFTFLNLAGRWRAFGAGPVGVELLGGVGYPTLDLKVSSDTQRVNDTLDFWGVSFAVGVI